MPSLRNMLSLVGQFGGLSGLAINTRKSVIMPVGPNDPPITELEGIPVSRTYQILGVWLSSAPDESYHYEKNFKPILDRMRESCGSWIHRNLSLKGRVTVFNSLILSLLQYMCSVTHTPKRVIDEAKRITVDFLWDGKPSKVAYSTLIQPTENGGLKLADLDSRLRANMLRWVARLDSLPESAPANFLLYLTKSTNIQHLLRYKMKTPPHALKVSPFYYALMRIWLEYHSFNPLGELAIRQETLWNNRMITDGRGKTLQWTRWDEAGIHTINHICHAEEGRILSHQEIQQKYPVTCTFLDSMRLRMGIPLHWRTSITAAFQGYTDPTLEASFTSGATICVSSSTAKCMYAEIVSTKKGLVSAQRKWDNSADFQGNQEWREIYQRPFKTTRETRIQAFQFRVHHRTITCARLLFLYRIRENDSCNLSMQTDTLEHFFYFCPVNRAFWKLVYSWTLAASGIDLRSLSLKELLLGVPRGFPKAKMVNYLLLYARYFIHRQRLFHRGDLSLIYWIRDLRARLFTERNVCRAEGRINKFQHLQRILDYTG